MLSVCLVTDAFLDTETLHQDRAAAQPPRRVGSRRPLIPPGSMPVPGQGYLRPALKTTQMPSSKKNYLKCVLTASVLWQSGLAMFVSGKTDTWYKYLLKFKCLTRMIE